MTYIQPIIISGNKNSGKTTYLKFLSQKIQKKGLKLAGYISEAEIQNKEKVSYHLVNLQTKEKMHFASKRDIFSPKVSVGDYYFNDDVFKKTRDILHNSMFADYIILDEIGYLELNGQGFFESFQDILHNYHGYFLFSVRTQIVGQVFEMVKKYKK